MQSGGAEVFVSSSEADLLTPKTDRASYMLDSEPAGIKSRIGMSCFGMPPLLSVPLVLLLLAVSTYAETWMGLELKPGKSLLSAYRDLIAQEAA